MCIVGSVELGLGRKKGGGSWHKHRKTRVSRLTVSRPTNATKTNKEMEAKLQ